MSIAIPVMPSSGTINTPVTAAMTAPIRIRAGRLRRKKIKPKPYAAFPQGLPIEEVYTAGESVEVVSFDTIMEGEENLLAQLRNLKYIYGSR